MSISVFERQFRDPIRTIAGFFTSLKWAWQRATKGYCQRDLWGVSEWFLGVFPDMLETMKKERVGFPTVIQQQGWELLGMSSFEEYLAAPEEIKEQVDDYAEKKWDEILTELAFLLREANEETCTKANPYEQEHHLAWQEFREKYGEYGEKLMTDEDKKREEETGSKRWFSPSDVPEYQEICNRYMQENRKIQEYRMECKDKAFQLFSEYFYDFWI